MSPLSDNRFRGGRVLAATLALLVSLTLLVPPTDVSAKEGPVNIAQGQIGQPPSGDLLFRILDFKIPAGQPAVPHSLGAGFVYAVDGVHVLLQGNDEILLGPGQGMWIGPQQQTEHAAVAGSSSHFWFIQLAPSTDRGTPPGWPYPYPNSSIAAESASFRPTGSGPYNLVLTDLQLVQPGESSGPMGADGTAGVIPVHGKALLGGQLFSRMMELQQPGERGDIVNAGSEIARVVAVRLLPANAPLELQPSALPNAGAAGESGWPWPLSTAGAALIVTGVILQRAKGRGANG